MKTYNYFNLRNKNYSNDINLLFPGWEGSREKLAVFGAHDDDPLIGAGYAMAAAMENGAEVFAVIFCKGDCGYSDPSQKDTIVEIRRKENIDAFNSFGIKDQNIIRFEYPDFSLGQYIGHKLQNGEEGSLIKVLDFIRANGITRVMLPNGYREHSDHTAAYQITMADVIQAGDAVVSDRGKIQKVKNYLQYSVWADFPYDDAIICGEKLPGIRANRAICCSEDVEKKVTTALEKYVSQMAIIRDLIASRKERLTSMGYLELYIDLDPRPKLSYTNYVSFIESIVK